MSLKFVIWKRVKRFLENIMEKEDAGYQHFLLFSTMFSTLPNTFFFSIFQATFVMSSDICNCFQFGQVKILPFGIELWYLITQFTLLATCIQGTLTILIGIFLQFKNVINSINSVLILLYWKLYS